MATSITVVIDPPLITDDIPTFNAKAFEAWQGLSLLGPEINAVSAETNATALAVEASADDATAAAATAVNAPGTSGNSTTSLLIGAGSKTLTIETGKLFGLGQWVIVASKANPANQMSGPITAFNPGTGVLTFDSRAQGIGGAGTYADWTVTVAGVAGSTGNTGPQGPITASAFGYAFSTTTSDADPGNGTIRFNNATQSSATSIFIDLQDATAAVLTTLLDAIGAQRSGIKAHVYIRSQSANADLIVFRVDSVTTATGYRKLVGVVVANSASSPFSNAEVLQVAFVPTGDVGTDLPIVAMGALDMDLSAGRYFTKSIAGNSTFTFSNIPTGVAVGWTMELTHTSGSITFPAAVRWGDNVTPVLTAGRTHVFFFSSVVGSSRVTAAVIGNATT